MTKVMRKLGIDGALAILLILLVISTYVTPVLCYFTTYAEVDGGAQLSFSTSIDIQESVEEYTKTVRVENTSTTDDCFVRVSYVCPSEYTITPEYNETWGEHLVATDSNTEATTTYFYYQKVLAPGEVTSPIVYHIFDKGGLEITSAEHQFNIMVIAESCPVIYGNTDERIPLWGYSDTYSG